MATEKNISSRIIHKHDIEANWNKATNFIPKAGEIIVYDKDETYDYERFKIGDGETVVINLPFTMVQPNWNQNNENAPDYIQNRPFYTIESVETVFLNEITINAKNGSTGLFTLPSSFQSNQTYKVIWDGAPYICQTYYVTPFKYVIGNVSLSPSAGGSGGNGEPFMIGEVMGNSVIFVSSPGRHTFSIFSFESESVIVKLPIEYHQNSNILNGSNDGAVKTIGAWDASGWYSFAEGNSTTASGTFSHAEGHETDATGTSSHAEGYKALASGNYSHAEGHSTQALEDYAHAEGSGTYATGEASHAEGHGTYATGDYSHAEGHYTIAASKSQHAQGEYNIEDSGEIYAHIVGNGTDEDARSNAHTLDWEGNAWFAGDVYVGSTSGTNKDEGSIKLVKETDLVQPDWKQTDETALDFIKNKPIEETEDDAMEMLFDMGIIIPAVDDGAILTDENGNILVI